MRTVAELIASTGIDIPEYLDREATVPALRVPRIQGDISFLPVTTQPAMSPIPAEGIVVSSGREGHGHRLLGTGFFDFIQSRHGLVAIGTLTVPEDSEVYAAHDKHGFMGFAPGSYRVGRQRGRATGIRRVAN